MNNDIQTANYLQYMLYHDDMYLRRAELEEKKLEYRGTDLLKVFQDTT